jgi:hypothetical protein
MKLIRYTHRTVTYGDWSVSCMTGTGIEGAILNVSRHRIRGVELTWNRLVSGFGDGRLFPSTEDAMQFAYDHGYLQLYFTHPDLRAKRIAHPFYTGPAKSVAA